MSSEQPKVGRIVSIVCARGLGDALISMILAHNLTLSGCQVTTFSSILYQLRDWFPQSAILPFPNNLQSSFSTFDTIIAADHSIVNETHAFGNQLIILKEDEFDRNVSIAQNIQIACQQRLGLPFSQRKNGIQPLRDLRFRSHPKRLVLHPTSSDTKKNWPADKFIALAKKLEKQGYSPYFCISPAERKHWEQLVPHDQLPFFSSVSDLASFVFESGYLIGNDSGVGHLASALNIPTLSLFARKSYAHLWRPGWGHGHVVTPPPFVLGARLKQKCWKQLLTVTRVHKAFTHLTQIE